MNKTLVIVVLCFLAIMLYHEYVSRQEKKQLRDEYEAMLRFEREENNQLIKDKNLLVEEIVSKPQNIVSEEQIKKYMGELALEYKRVNTYMKAEILSEISNIDIDFTPPSSDTPSLDDLAVNDMIHKDTVAKYFLKVPRQFDYSDDWMSMKGTVSKKFTLDTLKIINKFDVVLGYKKPEKSFKFLRKSEPVLDFRSYNPYSTIPYVNNLVVEKDRSMSRLMFSKPAFFIYGFFTNTLLNKTISNGIY